MNRELVEKVVHAVLYEGYILYPYRASARKNRQRFTFGRVYPEAYSVAENGAEPCLMQTECLAEGPASAAVEIAVRFLHPMARDIGALAAPLEQLPAPDNPDFFHEVPVLEVEGKLYQSWQEAVERTVQAPALSLAELIERPCTVAFSFPASRALEPIPGGVGVIAGVIVRRQLAVEGTVEIAAERIKESLAKITVRILNRTPVPPEALGDADEIVMRTFASTHTVLQIRDGVWVSLIDPPEIHAAAASACHQAGAWPILVGEEEKQERDTMVASPIILYDYPKIAAESPGDLYDSGEIDEILTLRIMTMTDEEKREMRGVDEHARRILERTEALPDEHLLKLHGAMRDTLQKSAPEEPPRHENSLDEAFFNPAARAKTVSVNGVSLREGDRVRVRPKPHIRADIMDIALAGKIAIIESIEQDAENKMHLALVLEDDPGRDLGFLKQPGHRFFFGADEVEPVESA